MAPLPWTAAAKDAFVASQFALQHRHFTTAGVATDRLIVELDGTAAGRLYVNRGRPLWRLLEIALCPAARGRGVGSALVDWLQRSARDDSACGIDLHVVVTNIRAAALYSRHGFVAVEGDADSHTATHRPMLWRVS
ncbi:GNAT family N-acetyltransferase [Sphingomonas sp. PB2P19]|uniref:GNAT family N-acetyltransferase n=1 Tax=Sphingomonas rhamnosi TaxID=3096156 RepID=UPI002FC60CF8